MNVFFCAIRLDGLRIPESWRRRFLDAPCCAGLTMQFVEGENIWGFAGGDAAGRRPTIAQRGTRIAIGTARLDHPSTVGGDMDSGESARATDLQRIMAAWPRDRRDVAALLGDFAFVLYDDASRSVLAARDAFGVDPLYCREFGHILTFASRAELLDTDAQYDRQFLVEFLARVESEAWRTPYAGVSAVPAAHVASVRGRCLTLSRYWSPDDFTTPDSRPSQALVAEFRHLLGTAVQTRLTPQPVTWAQLSGGLDSSSVVAMAQTLARSAGEASGLAGTVTMVDRHGTGGDERYYSDAVVREFGVRNELVTDVGCWEDDGAPPPRTDWPTPSYLVYARDRRLATIVRGEGGRVVLSGYGGDHCLAGSAIFLADWAAQGHLRAALHEAVRWSVTGHVSFWTFALHNIAIPLLPRRAVAAFVPAARVPEWMARNDVQAFGLSERTVLQAAYHGPRGHAYGASMCHTFGAMPHVIALHAVMQDIVEERHPYLYRPLVEFALRLPPLMCAQPLARKWILREAMRGILPEIVRTRPGKGSVDGAFSRFLGRERPRVRSVLEQSLLAEWGIIEPAMLLPSVDAATHGAAHLRSNLVRLLALETWLSVRSGRWTAAGTTATSRPMQSA